MPGVLVGIRAHDLRKVDDGLGETTKTPVSFLEVHLSSPVTTSRINT